MITQPNKVHCVTKTTVTDLATNKSNGFESKRTKLGYMNGIARCEPFKVHYAAHNY